MSAYPVRVMVVEDDPSLADVLCESMRDRGYAPLAAHTVAEALRLLEGNDFDVAVLDLLLPDGSGLEVLRRMADETRATEAIVLTGHGTADSAQRALKLGAYDYQTKPARIDELEAMVEKAADKARLRKENAALRVRLERQGWAAAAARSGLTLREVEREFIQAVLAANQGHRGRTARALGLDPKTLYNKLGASRPRRRAVGPAAGDAPR